jgi:gliding motility-associated lipoprotein GldD
MDNSIAEYINYSIDRVGEHKIKATAILDTTIIREKDNVYGTFFELRGNVASPFQFYLTDSTSRFYSGVVYFNARPNYDSILPSLNFVKKDLINFMQTLEWR